MITQQIKPTVSVVMASYNHELFVEEAIESVLNQTFQDFEIIITDDASTDRTVEVIESIPDDRIKFFKFSTNQGACTTLNHCITNATGRYIAVINSDDVWTSDKLQKQLDVFDKNNTVSAVFSDAEFLREDLSEFDFSDRPAFVEIFAQKNRSQGEWLRTFLFNGNCLCHPSVLIKKDCYDILGLYDNRFRQLPDFAMWIKFCKNFKLHVMPDKLVKFRILDGGKNASSPTAVNQIRGRYEWHLIAREFFDKIAQDTFKDGFSDIITNINFASEKEFTIEKALIYLSTEHRICGIEKLYNMLGDDSFTDSLKKYCIDDKKFHTINGEKHFFVRQEDVVSKERIIMLAASALWHYPKLKLFKILLQKTVKYLTSKMRITSYVSKNF